MNSDHQTSSDRVSIDEAEQLLCQLSGVYSARIVSNDWGAIEEIHVLSTADRNPKQIVRDIESVLAAKWKLTIDHKKVSVAQIRDDAESNHHHRFQVQSVEMSSDVARGQARVTVDVSALSVDATVRGTATGPHTRTHMLRLVAQAAIGAVNELLDGAAMTVDDVRVIKSHDVQVVLVVATMLRAGGSEHTMAGSEVINDDLLEAIATAVINCIERCDKIKLKGTDDVNITAVVE